MRRIFILAVAAACGTEATNPWRPAAVTVPVEIQTARLVASAVSTRFVTRDHFLASAEMQLAGEPFAAAMRRDLRAYSRDYLPTNIYFDTSPRANGPWIDLTGFSTAIETYEYSKQPMNMVAFESGAGTFLGYGPLINPVLVSASGPAAVANVAAFVQRFATGSNALGRFVFAAGTFPVGGTRGGDPNPLGAGKPQDNPIGWPGIWPTVHVFRSFDPTIAPTSDINLGCAITSDDSPGAMGALVGADYECSAATLHLVDRGAQIERVITPGADGASAWKYGLWVINYLQVMHDANEAAVAGVAEADLASVGAPGNAVVGMDAAGKATAPGTFLGSSDIEGFQAQMFLQELDDRAEDWLFHLTTTDGATLSGFADGLSALYYDYTQPLRWIPAEIMVQETADGTEFPKPSYALRSPDSALVDQAAMLLGYSEVYAITDGRNASVGGSQPVRAVFDGDPFPAQNDKATGAPTLHDRALALIRVTLINMDRLHADPATGVFVDDVRLTGASPSRGSTVATTSIAWAMIALRAAVRALGSQLQLYSNNVTDAAVGSTALDVIPVNPPGGGTLTSRARDLLRVHAELLMKLTDASGKAASGWSTAASAPTDGDALDAHAAAIRGLFTAFLATGDVRYRDRALAVFDRMQRVFYDPSARAYTATPAPVDSVEWTPMRFALLESALRDVYELVAARPGHETMQLELEARVGRLNKLVLNGWDDRNQDRVVQWPDECVRVEARLPRGGLQLAERLLTGEIGSFEENLKAGQPRSPTADREHDCVPEIDDARLSASLAQSITLRIERGKP